MAETLSRAGMLRGLTHCPVCGSPLALFQAFGRAGLSAKARFSCGGAFSTYEDFPIQPDRPCPGPGKVAADGLEREFAKRKGGAP